MRKLIEKTFQDVLARETGGETAPVVTDDLVLLESGLDSLGFAILVMELENTIGFDPFSISDEAYYPQTFGEFVIFYYYRFYFYSLR